MKLKMDKDGHVVVNEDGNPVYVHDDGKEIPFDAPKAFEKIKALGVEAKEWRLKYEKSEKTLKEFEGIEDPQAAIKAMATVKNLDQKKLIDAGEVEKVKGEVQKAMQAKIDDVSRELTDAKAVLQRELIGGRFARSKFISEKLVIPIDLVQAKFEAAFKIVDGKVIAHDAHGNQIYSKERPGEPADFEEAMSVLVDTYPNRDSIMKGSGAAGAGMQPHQGGRMGVADWHKLPPVERLNMARAGGNK